MFEPPSLRLNFSETHQNKKVKSTYLKLSNNILTVFISFKTI